MEGLNSRISGRTAAIFSDPDITMSLQQSSTGSNQTRVLINSLVLSQQKTLRTTHIALGVFSLLLAGVMVARILYDSWRASKLSVLLRPGKFEFLKAVHTAELFPFVLGVGLVIQQAIFIGIQGSGLSALLVQRCRATVQVMLPTLFLVGYMTLVFGVEIAIRSLKGSEPAPRAKWNTSICLAVVSVMLLMTWIPTIVWPAPDQCFGSLVWFTFHYRRVVLPLLSVLLFSYILLGAIITLRLLHCTKFENDERIAASRMVYYLGLALIEHTLVLPFFVQAYMGNFDAKFTTSRIAEISLFSSGIFIAFMHLFLRVNVDRMIIKPRGVPWHSRKKRIRIFGLFGPSDLEMNISRPLGIDDTLRYVPEKGGFVDYGYNPTLEKREKDRAFQLQQTADTQMWPLPPEPIIQSGSILSTDAPVGHRRIKSSYSLFPSQAEDMPQLPATVYAPPPSGSRRYSKTPSATARRTRQQSVASSITDIDDEFDELEPPKPPKPLFAHRHRRGSSADSSATVQIGLRLSVAPAAIAAANHSTLNRALAPPGLRGEAIGPNDRVIGPPVQRSSTVPSRPQTSSKSRPSRPVATQRQSRMSEETEEDLRPLFTMITPHNSGKYLQNARNKVLPPTPVEAGQARVSGLRMNPVSPAGLKGPDLASGTIKRFNSNKMPPSGWI